MIEQAGGIAIRFPVIEITAVDGAATKVQLDRLHEYDLAIFISANAVEYACQIMHARGGWPDGLQFASVGKKTAECLSKCLAENNIVGVQLSPDKGFNSEALLALPALQEMMGKKVMIFRGNGGRELLAETLSARGAHVAYAEVYQRRKPEADVTPLLSQKLDIVIATSNEGLKNLYDMSGGYYNWLLNLPLLLMSKRLSACAKKLGFRNNIIIADEASDEGLMRALCAHR